MLALISKLDTCTSASDCLQVELSAIERCIHGHLHSFASFRYCASSVDPTLEDFLSLVFQMSVMAIQYMIATGST